MDTPMFVLRDEDCRVEFRWHGGAYIDYGQVDENGEFHAANCINVWNYETDEPLIPRTLEAFKTRCMEHMAEDAA